MMKSGRVKAATIVEVAYRLMDSLYTQRIVKISKLSEKIKSQGLSATETSRLRQYERFIGEAIENLRMFKMYRTPQALRSFGRIFTFGADVVSKFLNRHDLDLICRAHQVVEDGYEFFAKRQLVTLFSAPNYCGEFDNAGGMMSVDETLMCSFQILKPSEKKAKYQYQGLNRPQTPRGPQSGPPAGIKRK